MQSAGSQSKIDKFHIEIKMRKMKRDAAECDIIEKWQPVAFGKTIRKSVIRLERVEFHNKL